MFIGFKARVGEVSIGFRVHVVQVSVGFRGFVGQGSLGFRVCDSSVHGVKGACAHQMSTQAIEPDSYQLIPFKNWPGSGSFQPQFTNSRCFCQLLSKTHSKTTQHGDRLGTAWSPTDSLSDIHIFSLTYHPLKPSTHKSDRKVICTLYTIPHNNAAKFSQILTCLYNFMQLAPLSSGPGAP